MGGNVGATRSLNIREVELARAYKFCVKRIMDTVDARTGGGDSVIREAVMYEMQVFYHKALGLMGDTKPHVLEEFVYEVNELVCRYTRILGTSEGD